MAAVLSKFSVLAFAMAKKVKIHPYFYQFLSDSRSETGFRVKPPTAHLVVLFNLVELFVLVHFQFIIAQKSIPG